MSPRRHRPWVARASLGGACALICASVAVATVDAAESPPIVADAPFTAKIRSLLYESAPGRPAGEGPLRVDEKISLVHGMRPIPPEQALGQAGYTPGVPRLGIPDRRDADALGINVATETTAPPTKMAIAASFDRSAAAELGHLEGVEGRAVKMDVLYGPQLDISRIPGASRNQTTAGEDPFLISSLGVAEINEIQAAGLMSEAKHFALYNQSTNTGGGNAMLNVNADQQTLREIYLAPFDAAVKDGRISSLMCSYQKSFGQYTCEQPLLLNDILRGEWDFRGFVLSDYGATHSLSILQGLDTSFPSGLGPDGSPFFTTDLEALVDPASPTYNSSYAEALDRSVARILYQYERFGLLDGVPPRPTLDKAAGITVAERLAEKSAVLLQNRGSKLPLERADLASAAVIGPTARQLYVGVGGERSRGFNDRTAISPLQALRDLAPAGSDISYSPGIDWLGSVVPASALGAGLTRTQDNSGDTQVDATIDYAGAQTLAPGATYTWTGTLTAPSDDTYRLQLQRTATDPSKANPASVGVVTLEVDGVAQTLANPVPGGPVPIITTPDGLYNTGAAVPLTAGQHAIKITYAVPTEITTPVQAAGPTPPVNFRFTWSALGETVAAAVDAARDAEIAVVFANDSPGGNSTPDRDPSTLQADQDDLIAAVAEANPNTVVVLNTGSAVEMPWAADVKSILELWHTGQEGGTATAKLLLGQVNPGGKLPMTFPARSADTPVAGHPERFPGVDAHGQAATSGPTTETYTEGIFMGYRWYDQQDIEPLFEFGHGLSYTRFAYTGLRVTAASGGRLTVRFRVENTGTRAGDEVPQVYVGRPARLPNGVQMAPKVLAAYTRVALRPRQSRAITLTVKRRQLSSWSTAQRDWIVASGRRPVYVGASSRDIRLERSITVR